MDVSRATFFLYDEDTTLGVKAGHNKKFGSKKPRVPTLQAIATLKCFLEKSVDHMPHRLTTLLIREVVVTKTLHLSFK